MDFSNFWWQVAAAPPVGNSLRFRGSQQLTGHTGGSGTASVWIKRAKLGAAQTVMSGIAFAANDTLNGSTAVFRDPGAWMHVVVNSSGTYVNGASVGSGSSISAGTIGASCDLNLADFRFIDGQTLGPTNFGEFDANDVWTPKEYTGAHGTEGFYLNFSDPANIGKDYSGNGNDYSTATGFELTDDDDPDYDLMADSPTQNFATLNPLVRRSNNTAQIADFENANLTASTSNSNTAVSTFNFSTTTFTGGAYAVEAILDSVTTTAFFGVAEPMPFINDTGGWSVQYMNDGNIVIDQTTSSYGDAYVVGDRLRCEFDYDNGTVEFFLNGTSQGQVAAVPPQGVELAFIGQTPRAAGFTFNYGQQPYVDTPSAGFSALQTQNLPAATILDGRDHFRAITDTGADILTAAQAAFDNGLWWVKDRANSNQHQFVDSVRGGNLALTCPAAQAEGAYVAPLGDSVAWCWKAGDSVVTNNDGDLESQVSANTTAGFSIVTWTSDGANSSTIGHGLTEAPQFIIYRSKLADSTYVWTTVVDAPSDNHTGSLNVPNALGLTTLYGSPSDSIITNFGFSNGTELVAYCWHSVPGYSQTGTYQGNTSADGPFIATNFRPAFVLIKGYNGSSSWTILDSTRDIQNPAFHNLYPNGDYTEATNSNDGQIDIVSNGFKCRSTGGSDLINFNNTWNYVYMAFAENPFGGSSVSPATAR